MKRRRSILGELVHGIIVMLAAVSLTLVLFMVLPLMQAISQKPATDLVVQAVDTANIPPPPPPPPEEPPKEEEKQEEPPELQEEVTPLDLSQIELALNVGTGGVGSLDGDTMVKLPTDVASGSEVDSIFSLSDLDQQPRVIYQPGPQLTNDLRKKSPATVYVIFLVNAQGRVESPIVQKSSNPLFNDPALNAVKQWRFEPGKRNGQPVRFRMRVPITFPKEN
ncbi:MAG: TonB family protein [Phycisphaera sp.]|nr:TonB family protein [Phycisphaera sp.]